MLAAKQSASTAGSPSVTSALQTSDADSQDGPSKKQRARKASETEASSVEVNQEPAEEPPLKKKKSVKLAESSKTASKLVDDETGTAERSTNKKAAAANDKIRAVPKKKATVTVEIQPKINDDSSTASETTKIGQKSKKKAGAKSDDVEKPVAKRAKKGESLKTSAVKKTTEKVMPAVKVATPETESSHGSQSSNHEVVSGEETEAVETPVSKKKATGKLKEIGELKGFKKIMAETSKRIAATKEASGARNGSVEPEQGLKQSVKSVDSTASESSVDSDHSSIVGKRVEHSPEKATFVESDSFSSSDEEGLNYSQSLLADLTKNDKEDGLIASENGEKSKQVDRTRGDPSAHHSQDTEQSQDMPSSELTQKPQESNSVLLRSLSRNRFSLGSMPVAKLKKSSKNPFKKAKADTSSAADRPRGRPRKVELE
ncbi:unnamed protein product [Hyaloperonospora brassicae]|uniref:Uncharacterized protein n=1 Tax=Hyaloperonospora brassicae TaxID=162125 RepID=A0AAV0UXW7_HYABA|nr:unnamed protein product [Hyaloperonospora brassicae]